jgi:hypothetical protein
MGGSSGRWSSRGVGLARLRLVVRGTQQERWPMDEPWLPEVVPRAGEGRGGRLRTDTGGKHQPGSKTRGPTILACL